MTWLLLILAQAIPDPALTPGAIDPAVNQQNIAITICRHGYTAEVRNVSKSEKTQVLSLYTSTHPHWPEGPYEIDHLVSLELGGSNDISNLWPQPYCPLPHQPDCLGAREKDVVETDLKKLVCSGKMTLAEAQRRIVADWVSEYRRIKGQK